MQYQNRGKGCEEIPRQRKDLRIYVKKGSSDLKIKQTIVLSKKYMPLKTRGSERVPQSKSIYSRLIFSKQLINWYLFEQ